MVLLRTVLGLVGLLATSHARYVLQKHTDASNFESEFEAAPEREDPTHGSIEYERDWTLAKKEQLLGTREGEIYIGMDHKTRLPPANPKRKSIRARSKTLYTTGLFIFDVTHMPVGAGVWPAIWTFGAPESGPGNDRQWPDKGEIDVVEGVHNSPTNSVSLHSSGGCEVSNGRSTNELTMAKGFERNCNAGNGEMGCKQETKETDAYGPEFNRRRGGVYAMEWTDEHIAVWFFPRGGKIPDMKNPDPASWGLPRARFTPQQCDFKKHFRLHRIIINITACGGWAGNVWGVQEACPGCTNLARTCPEYVATNPQNFTEAYWQIKSITTLANK